MSNIHIKASQCQKCEKVIIPPRTICPYCRTLVSPSDTIHLNNQGIVLSYTELLSVPEGFQSPLRLALIQLEYGAVVLSLAHDDFDSDLVIGATVELAYDSENRLRFHSTR